MLPFAFQVVILLFVIGGLIAYIGNFVGRYIGKRRLTLFNMRPRHTATAITVISGVLIAVSTLLVLLLISQDARMAFLGLEKLKVQINEKTTELSAANKALELAKSEISQLQEVKKELSHEIRLARQGEVIYKKGEIVSLSLIKAGPEKEKIEVGLRRILSDADANLRRQGIRSAKPLVTVPADEFNQTVYNLLNENKLFIVELVSTRNALWGEEIPAGFELAENKLIYREGEEIINSEVAAGLTSSQAEQEVMRVLTSAHQAAREAGLLPDSLGSIPYGQIYDVARKIKGSSRKTTLRILAKKNIFTIGPLEVQFKVN